MAENKQRYQENEDSSPESGDDYELMPHREIIELRDELRKLKMQPNEKTLQISMVELAAKVDKLIDIFSEAMHEIRIEEGGLTFQDKMKPLIDRMETLLEQNSQIAEGVVAVADMLGELKDVLGAPSSKLPGISLPSSNPPPSFDWNQPPQSRPPRADLPGIPPLPPPRA